MHSTTTQPSISSIQSKTLPPKRGLRLEQGFHINLDNLCAWSISPEQLHFEMADENIINIYLKDSKSSKYSSETIVEINDFKRIERELMEYMGMAK
jgi:hypothetical protein